MLRRVSSSFFTLVRTASSSSTTTWRQSMDATPATSLPQTKSKLEIASGDHSNNDGQAQASPATNGATVEETKDQDTTERDAFSQTLDINTVESAEALIELPYTFDEDLCITSDGVLCANVDMGLDGIQPNFHIGLRRQPSVAERVTRLELIIRSPSKAKESDEDSMATPATLATHKEGLLEWARTVPALKNLSSIKVAHLGEATTTVQTEESFADISMLMKSLAWFIAGEGKLVEMTLEGVDCSDDATRAWEGAKITKLTLDGCKARVSALVPRLPRLKEVKIVERSRLSAGCDYIGLLSHVKPHLQSITLTLLESRIDINTFIEAFSGYSPLNAIDCPFTPSQGLNADEIEKKLQRAFPKYHPSPDDPTVLNELNVDRDVEMGVLEPGTSHNKSPISRTATMEKRKEELKISEAAKKEKGRIIGSTIRRLRAAATGRR